TPEQAEKLRRLCERIVLCYDGDAAGRAATRAAIALCLAQGLSVFVARMPAGEDPDDVFPSSRPGGLARPSSAGPHFLPWLLDEVRPGEPGLSAAERSARIAALLDGVKEIPDAILRHEECRRIAEAVGVPLEVLWDRIKPREIRQAARGTHSSGDVLS